MGAIETMRDALFQNPPVANHQPSAEGILAAFTELDRRVVGGAAGVTSYSTLDELPSSIDPDSGGKPLGSQARVYADPTAANNTYWIRTATSGTNNGWTVDQDYIDLAASVVQPLVDEAIQAAEAINELDNALSSVTKVGLSEDPETGFSASDGTYVFGGPAARTGRIALVRAFGATSGSLTIEVRRFVKVGGAFSQIGVSVPVVVDSGDNSKHVSIPINAGEYIGFYAPTAAFTYTTEPASSGAWYYAAGDVTSVPASSPTTSIRLQIGFDVRFYSFASTATVDLLRADYTSLTANDFDLVVNNNAHANGLDFASAVTLAFPAAASGKERIDLVVMNRVTGAIARVAGGERDQALDAIEWQGSVPAGSVLLARSLITSTSAIHANCSTFRGLVKRNFEGEHAAHVARNRAILAPVLEKASRGDPINLGGYGDSITAFQSVNAPSDMPITPNGTLRDRPDLYFVTYPSDTKAAIPLFNFADGAGTVHCRIGWNWAIKAALDALAGASATTYLNYGIGGTTSAATMYNGLNPARIAEPLGDDLDLVTIAFGMNERGSATTYANIVDMIGQFQTAGAVPVVIGCPRPNAAQSVIDWRYTNDALEAAAMDAGAAYISTAMIAEDRNLGAIGVPAETLGSTTIAGAGNHPGLFELGQYSRATLLQLGLGR